jgi:hypothetical protein
MMRFGRFAVAAVAATVVAAATTGPVGAQSKNSSTASTTVTASVPDLVSIRKLDNITFEEVLFSGTQTEADDVCVWTNTSNGYKLTVDSTNGSYTLTNGQTTDELAYDVAWSPQGNADDFSAATQMPYGTQRDFNSTNFSNPACKGGTNASLLIQLQTPSADSPVAQGDYTDEVTLTVEPL